MSDSRRHLQLPLTETEARGLELGQMVTVTGTVFTGRSLFHIRAIEEDILPPVDFDTISSFFHVGPVMRKTPGGWEVVSIEPTSSIRFERYGADVVRKLNLRVLLGKTTMGPRTAQALADVGGVYLSKVGICGNILGPQVTQVRDVHFLDQLGKTEATWIFEVRRFGPFFVAIDAAGNSYFENLNASVCSQMDDVYTRLGVPVDFEYTDVGADVTGVCESRDA